jgi:hypothetical protein
VHGVAKEAASCYEEGALDRVHCTWANEETVPGCKYYG